MAAPGEMLLLVLLLLAAAMSGAFARLLRLPAAPVAVLFGALLAHGPSAVFDAQAAAALQPVAGVALCVAALATGLRLSTPQRAFRAERPAVAGHVLAEVAAVPLAVWLALVLLGGVPPQVALLVGLMALASTAEALLAAARRAGAEAAVDGLLAVARADLAASLALAMAAVFALRLHFDPAGQAHGLFLPLAACSLALGASLGVSAPGLMMRLAGPTARAFGFSLAVAGTLAGATILPALLPHALFIASLAVSARLLAKCLAAAWGPRGSAPGVAPPVAAGRATPGGSWWAGCALAPGGLLGVALILVVRGEPALAGFADMFLAVGVWIATLNATLGPVLARLAVARLFPAADAASDRAGDAPVSPAPPPAGAGGRPPAR